MKIKNELEARLHALWNRSKKEVETPYIPVDLYLSEVENRYHEYLKKEVQFDSAGLMAMMH